MKTNKFNSRNSEKIKSEADDNFTLEKGITKTLLEKYRPKVIYNLETLSERKDKRKAA